MRVGDVVVTGAVEGFVDESVFSRIVEHVGAIPGPVYGRQGKGYIRRGLRGFNAAAAHTPWLVLMDLDSKPLRCPPALVREVAPPCEHFMCFRIAVHEVESWLLADAEQLAGFLKVSQTLIPKSPDSIEQPVVALLQIAATSKVRYIREQLIPRPESGAKVGPNYNSLMSSFVSEWWRPEVARVSSPSLARCIDRLVSIVTDFAESH